MKMVRATTSPTLPTSPITCGTWWLSDVEKGTHLDCVSGSLSEKIPSENDTPLTGLLERLNKTIWESFGIVSFLKDRNLTAKINL